MRVLFWFCLMNDLTAFEFKLKYPLLLVTDEKGLKSVAHAYQTGVLIDVFKDLKQKMNH